MRVISGKYRGLKLAGFAGTDVRPTADRIKESLFNILNDKVAGAEVLDLFCGSGSLGIECLSRGAKFVHFNDVSAESLNILKRNLDALKKNSAYGDGKNIKITDFDYLSCLARADRFDLIFLDPPYKSEAGPNALEIIGERKLLNGGGIAVLERDRSFSGNVAGLKQIDERKYGITYLAFFEEG